MAAPPAGSPGAPLRYTPQNTTIPLNLGTTAEAMKWIGEHPSKYGAHLNLPTNPTWYEDYVVAAKGDPWRLSEIREKFNPRNGGRTRKTRRRSTRRRRTRRRVHRV